MRCATSDACASSRLAVPIDNNKPYFIRRLIRFDAERDSSSPPVGYRSASQNAFAASTNCRAQARHFTSFSFVKQCLACVLLLTNLNAMIQSKHETTNESVIQQRSAQIESNKSGAIPERLERGERDLETRLERLQLPCDERRTTKTSRQFVIYLRSVKDVESLVRCVFRGCVPSTR